MAKKTSIGGWAYIWGGYSEAPIPLEDVLKRISELGFDGFELGAFPPHLPANTKVERMKVKKLLEKYHLGLSGVAAPAPSPATSKEEDYIKAVKDNLELCVDLNIPKLRVETVDPPTGIPGGMDYETCFEKVASIWNKAADVCAKEGVKLVWEFEPGFLFNKPSEVVRMVYKVDHPNFLIMFDSCHAYMSSVVGARHMGKKEILPKGVVQFLYMLTGKIGAIHLIDSDGTLHDNNTSTHAPLGTGLLNFDEIIPAIIDAGYKDDWWTIDLCFWPKALEVTADCKIFLDKLIDKYIK
ncbi:sugar phosphate isomerase/epimerase [bacterium]|nr:sugar phosphate isomerase/epimerase [bacterium]